MLPQISFWETELCPGTQNTCPVANHGNGHAGTLVERVVLDEGQRKILDRKIELKTDRLNGDRESLSNAP